MVSEPTAGAAPKFDPDRTALVLVEFQRQWIDLGLYNLLVRRSLAKHDVVERTRDTVRAARDAGVLVVHAPLVIDLENKRGWLATLTRGLVFTESTPRVAFTPGLYCEGDPVVEGRYTFDAFGGSDLRTILWQTASRRSSLLDSSPISVSPDRWVRPRTGLRRLPARRPHCNVQRPRSTPHRATLWRSERARGRTVSQRARNVK